MHIVVNQFSLLYTVKWRGLQSKVDQLLPYLDGAVDRQVVKSLREIYNKRHI